MGALLLHSQKQRNLRVESSVRSYLVEVGNGLAASIEGAEGDEFLVISDKLVWQLHHQKLSPFVRSQPRIELESSENLKSYEECGRLLAQIFSMGVSRQTKIIAIGGGSLQDAVAFVSSILFRGIEWWFVPTTLISQGDSCIGGKTSINFGESKNQIGTFHPPSRVVIDTGFLGSLDSTQYWSGIGELAHYFALDTAGFAAIGPALFERQDEKYLTNLVVSSLEIKRKFIESDEYDTGERLLLNFGHTFAHALEAASGKAVPHGQAVAAGMRIAFGLSAKLGFLDQMHLDEVLNAIGPLLSKFEFPIIEDSVFIRELSRDKKSTRLGPVVVLSRGYGDMFLHQLILDQPTKKLISGELNLITTRQRGTNA